MSQNEYKVFIGNLNFRTSKKTLEKTFSEFGKVTDVSIPIYHDRNRPKGYAFVEFSTKEAAKKALYSCQGLCIDGREVIVNSAAPEKKVSNNKIETC